MNPECPPHALFVVLRGPLGGVVGWWKCLRPARGEYSRAGSRQGPSDPKASGSQSCGRITRPCGVIIAYPHSQLRRSTCRARRILESVALRVLCSNCALSPAPQRACRSGRDTELFSCGGGTPHTRDDASSQGFAQATRHFREEQSEEKLYGVQPPTGCLQIEQHLRAVAQFQTDCPSLVESDRCRRRKRLLLQIQLPAQLGKE